MPYPESVETDRLMLRRLRADDEDAFLAVWMDPDVRQALRPGKPFDPVYGRSRFDHHLQHWDAHGFGLWLVEGTKSRDAVGCVGPSHPDHVLRLAGEIEIGWTLRRQFWGRGIAIEAARAAVSAAFEHLRPPRLVSLIHPGNTRSAAVAKRLGMNDVAPVEHAELGLELRLYVLEAPKSS